MAEGMLLPRPCELAALGVVLCLYRVRDGSELQGWTQAVRASCDSVVDSNGLCERLNFYDADGRCCWRQYLLPDTDFLAWDRMLVGLPPGPSPLVEADPCQRLWQRLMQRVAGEGWRARVLRFHALPDHADAGGKPALAASLPRLSACGAEAVCRIARREGIEGHGWMHAGSRRVA